MSKFNDVNANEKSDLVHLHSCVYPYKCITISKYS